MTSQMWIIHSCFLFLLSLIPSHSTSPRPLFLAEEWMEAGKRDLHSALGFDPNLGLAKNVILFVGDGMGVSTVTAARIYKGQRDGRPGEETQLSFEQFPYVALSKVYNTDKQVPDSAGTSTAFLSGVKVNSGTLGVDARVQRQNCTHMSEAALSTILDWAIAAGKWTGLVTTTRVTHATPAASFAHTADRDWESDATMTSASDLCKARVKDIAAQLVDDVPNSDIRVILGGGRVNFLPNTALDPDTLEVNVNGRLDGRDLTEIWLNDKGRQGFNASYVWTRQQLEDIDVRRTDFLMGLFNPSHMEFDLGRNSTGVVKEPSLSEMVSKAIGLLSKNPQGYFLLVEGGRIDHAHHVNLAHLALGETVALDQAVRVASHMTGDDTLLVVTADHSHVFTMGGYPDRGHDILGKLDPLNFWQRAGDQMPYTVLSYANGPSNGRVNLTEVDTTSVLFQQSRLVPTPYETHAGEDVAIYATGPMAHLFRRVHEQSYIAHVMAYASCLGPYSEQCSHATTNKPPTPCDTSGATSARWSSGMFAALWRGYVWVVVAVFLGERFLGVSWKC